MKHSLIGDRVRRWAVGLPARHGGRLGLAALGLILALGLGLRLHDALDPNVSAGKDSIVAYKGADEQSYTKIAAALYETGRYGTPEMSNPNDWNPGGPIVWAGVYYATGGVRPRAARVFTALLSALTVLFVYLIGRRFGGPLVGLIAAGLTATYPVFIYYAGHFVTEPLGAFWLSGTMLGFLWASDSGRPLWAWILPGALLGATALTRPEYLPFAALLGFLVIYRVSRQHSFKLGLVAAVIFGISCATVIAPWTLRNYLVLDRFVPISTGGGKALFVATYYPGDGRQLPVKRALIAKGKGVSISQVTDKEVGATQMADLLDREARRYPELDRDAALGKLGKENFRRYFKEHPLGYARMVATKMWHVWRRSSSPTMRSSGWIAYHYALLVLGAIGLIALSIQRRWEALVVGVLIVGITVLGGVLLGVPRRNVPLMPLVMALAAFGINWLRLTAVQQLRNRRYSGSQRSVGPGEAHGRP